MKTKSYSDYLIATIVVVCSLALLGALLVVMGGFSLGDPGRQYYIDFRDSTGLEVGVLVRYAGKPIGSLQDLRTLSNAERREADEPGAVIRGTIGLDEDAPALTEGLEVMIGMESLLGGKFIALVPGPPDALPLAEGSVLLAREGGLMANLESASGHLDGIVERFSKDYDDLIPGLAVLADEAGGVMLQASNLVANLNGAVTNLNRLSFALKEDYGSVYGPKLTGILGQVEALGTNANATVGQLGANASWTVRQAGAMIESNRANLDKMIAELRVVSQNLKVLSTYTKALTGQLGEKPSRVIWGKKQDVLPTEAEILASPEPIVIEWDQRKKRK